MAALDFAGLKRAVRDLSPTQINGDSAGRAINAAYQSLIEGRPGGGIWFGLKTSVTLTVLPDRTGGQVQLIQGARAVFGTGTAFDPAVDPLRFLKIQDKVPLRIDTVESPTLLTLAQEWGEETLGPTSYNIMSTRYLLPPDADRVHKLVGPHWPLKRRAFESVDIVDPGRNVRGEPMLYQERELLEARSAALAQANTLSGTVPVLQGSTTVQVALQAETSGYQVAGSPSWNTTWDVRANSKTSISFIIDFAIGAPPGATFDWVAVVPGAVVGLGVIETTKEIELWPVPNAYYTLSLEYRKRVEDLVNDWDVPILPGRMVQWAGCSEMANRLFARTGDESWSAVAAKYGEMVAPLLATALKEDRKVQGALSVVLDSEDPSPLGDADWYRGWRMYSSLFGGRLA